MSQMSNWIGIGVAVALGAAALLVAIFYPAPLNRSEQTISPYTPANPDVEPGRYTKAFVDAAIERYDDEGRDATLAYYNSPESVDGQWYVFIADEGGRIVAHPTVKDNIGRSLDEVLGADINGYRFGEEMLSATEEGKWVDYSYLNPARRNQQEVKHTWVIRHDGLLFGSGWYERSEDTEYYAKANPAGYTQAFVEKALSRYELEGRESTIEYYNARTSVDGQWYVFIIDENDVIIAHPTIPENIGQDLKGPLGTDIYGKEFGRELIAATEDGQWVEYFYDNPANDNRRETKHAWAVRHDGLVFVSGWYEVTAITDFLLPPEAFDYLKVR